MIRKLSGLLFQNRTLRQTIMKNFFWLSFGQIASRLIRAFIIVYSARVLGAAEYGIFSYALGLSGFFTVFADIGITSILTREVARRPEEGKKYFATAFWIKIALLSITSLLVLFAAPFFSRVESATPLLPFVALLMFFDNLREFSFSYFRAKERMQIEAMVLIGMNVAITVIGFIVISGIPTARALTAAYVGSAGIGMLATVLILRREYAGAIKNFAKTLVRPLIKSALPVALIALFGSFMLNIDTVMLGWWRTEAEIGFYSAAQKIVQVLYTIPAIFAIGVFPAISRFVGEKNREKVRALHEKTMGMVLMIAVPLSVGGITLAKPIIQFLYGAEYIPAVPVFQILIATVLFIFPGTLLGNFILAHDKQAGIAKYTAISSCLNIILNSLLIPRFGIVGAAVATIVVQGFYNSSFLRLARKINPSNISQFMPRIIIASAALGCVGSLLSFLGIHVLISIAVAGIVYFGLLFAMKESLLKNLADVLFKKFRGTVQNQ